MNGSQRVVFGAWLAMIALATARSLGGGRGLPQPGTYLASGVLFTLYLGAASFLGPLVAVFAVGTDLAAVLLPYYQGGKVGPLDQIAAGLQKLSGGKTTSSSGSSQGNLTP